MIIKNVIEWNELWVFITCKVYQIKKIGVKLGRVCCKFLGNGGDIY